MKKNTDIVSPVSQKNPLPMRCLRALNGEAPKIAVNAESSTAQSNNKGALRAREVDFN